MTDKQLSDLDSKLKTLSFRLYKTDEIIAKKDRQSVERQLASIAGTVASVNEMKEAIEERKFSKGESEQEVSQWSATVEQELAKADEEGTKLTHQLKLFEREERDKEMFERHQQNLKYEREILEQKLSFDKQQQQDESKATTDQHVSTAKLPKLQITKFDGKVENWLAFWGKFISEIDKTDLPSVTKFGYLKELLEKNVRNDIDGLPFNEDGYDNAKAILEAEYGNESDIINAYTRNIMDLPAINDIHPRKIKEFYKKLRFNVQSLETLGKLDNVKGNVRLTLDKLKIIKADLVRGHDNWRDWGFKELLTEMKKWLDINPVEDERAPTKPAQPKQPTRATSGKMFYSKDSDATQVTKSCLYCNSANHKAINCDQVTTIEERKKILADKRLCFNCTGSKHRAADCKSKSTCQKCGARHHTSICNKEQLHREPGMTANHVGKTSVIHPVVVVKIKGFKFRALLDSGASHSYASATAINIIKATPKSSSVRQIAMLTGITTKNMQTYDVVMESVSGEFKLDVNITKVERQELLTLDNPSYKDIIDNHSHMRGVQMDDTDDKEQLPVHLIIGANDFAKIRTGERLRVGRHGDPVAEYTRFGWCIMSPGAETGTSSACVAVNSTVDYEKLCALDVLGLADNQVMDQDEVYTEFKEQLTRSSEGWYETGLPWKNDCDDLLPNCKGSKRRLGVLVRKLQRTDMLDNYDAIIREQFQDGVVEKAPIAVNGKEFYLPHRAVVRDNAETTKIRVVYDASARERDGVPSLNECLHTGPPLNNLLWNVVTRQRFHPVALTGDLQKAFLQIRVKESERDALRFHWLVDKTSRDIEVLRFTRVVFGLAPSPFLLNGVLQQHLDSMELTYPDSVDEIKRSLYVDDLISGAPTLQEAKQLKNEAVKIFNDATFKLHKWGSNIKELESADCNDYHDVTFAKDQLIGSAAKQETKLLGLAWEKETDTLHVNFPSESARETKRGVLANLAKVYDPLGLASPVTLEGKRLYREMCLQKLGWDTPLPNDLVKLWKGWEQSLPDSVGIPRSIPIYQEPIQEIQLHAFGDASGYGVCATIYAVVSQVSGISQGLITAKSRLAKEGLTIPRLELIAGHMAVNLASNVRKALDGFPLTSKTECWLDSTVALHWIHDRGEYRQFVANRVRKIQGHSEAHWNHVPTKENPADLGSRGGSVTDKQLWWTGPEWLPYPDKWPPKIVTTASSSSERERKVQQELFAAAVEVNDCFDHMLKKFGLHKAMRICAWVLRFIHNSRHPSKKIQGPLTTEEITGNHLLIKHAQQQGQKSSKFIQDKNQLNLQVNGEGILVCRGRIQGEFPIYLPDNSTLATQIVKHAHLSTLHGGVSMTMAKVHERFWVPRLRRLARRELKNCWGCKRFHAVPLSPPPTGNLPIERTEGTTPFNVIGVDFAGPIKYSGKDKCAEKAYVVLYSCCLTRGVFLEVLPSLETEEFIKSFKRLIARRGRPSIVYSDNGSTFVAASKWLKSVQEDEKFHEFCSSQTIIWRFNVSRAPWWGGHFERLIGLFKSAFYKTVGQGYLSWDELCEVVLDIEVTLNNRPLCYMEEDHQLPTLTPNSMLFPNTNLLPELQPYHLEEMCLRKRAKFILATKDAMWRRWTGEYLRALRERHQIRYGSKESCLKVGDVVIVKSDERNRNQWPLAIVTELYTGRDGIVRAARLRKGKGHIDRAIQHLYPLELSCDVQPKPVAVPEATVQRPRRGAAVAARSRIQNMLQEEDEI